MGLMIQQDSQASDFEEERDGETEYFQQVLLAMTKTIVQLKMLSSNHYIQLISANNNQNIAITNILSENTKNQQNMSQIYNVY